MTIRIDGTNTAVNPGITGSDTDTGLQFGTDEVNIVTGGSTRATVDSSGNLVLDGGSDVRIELGSNGTTATNDRNHIRGDGDNIKFNTCADGLLIFEQNGTEELRIQSGGGISFNGDTAAANALDDYEEGTWTPTIVWSGGSTSVTYSRQFGGYVKIGNVVHFYGYLALTNFTGASGQLKLSNFPFAAKNQTFYYHAPAIGWYNNLATTSYGLGLDIAPNSTSHNILRGTGTGTGSLGPSDINSNFACEWSFTVHVN